MTTTHMLEIAGADIAYDVRGPLPSADGRPPLFMIGQPMDASGFETLASHFTDRTVTTYDPRGLGRSVRKYGRGGAPRGGFGGGAGPRGRNLLKEHFLASDAFRDVYLAEYRKLYESSSTPAGERCGSSSGSRRCSRRARRSTSRRSMPRRTSSGHDPITSHGARVGPRRIGLTRPGA